MGAGNDVGGGAVFAQRQRMSQGELISNMSLVSDAAETVHLPLPKRYPPVGLKNWGNTCYANAALQCLLSTALARALLEPKCFREFKRYASNIHLLNKELHASHSTDTDDFVPVRRNMKKKPKVSEVCLWITKELTHLCQYYTGDPSRIKPSNSGLLSYFSRQPAVLDPGGITRHVTKLSSCLTVGRQEDAHEFLRALISNLVMDGQNRKLSALFDGLLESAVTCQHCGHASLTRDRYMDISLEIQGNSIHDLEGAFKRFTTTEHLSPDNMVECEKCRVKRRVTKGLRLATAPTILVCHLKRFDYDIYGRVVRLNKKVSFPLRLEIGEFMSRANRSKPPPYELVSVLVHQGRTCNSGHYLSYVKSDGEWYRASDDNVEKVPVSTVLAQRAYILIYEVEGMRNHKIRQAGNDSRSFEGSTTTQSLISNYTHLSLDSVVSARSEPTVLSSIFQIMGSCGMLPTEIDCCNVKINSLYKADEPMKRPRVQRSRSDQERRSSKQKKRKSKSKKNKLDPDALTPARRRRQNEEVEPERDLNEVNAHYRTMSEPLHIRKERHFESMDSLPLGLDSMHSLSLEKHFIGEGLLSTPTNKSDPSQFSPSFETVNKSIDTCLSETVYTNDNMAPKPNLESIIRPAMNNTPSKGLIRSSSSNNLRERSVEAANAYGGLGRSRRIHKSENCNEGKQRSSSVSRSTTMNRGDDPIESERHLDIPTRRTYSGIKMRRRISSRLSSGSPQLPPLSGGKSPDFLDNTIH